MRDPRFPGDIQKDGKDIATTFQDMSRCGTVLVENGVGEHEALANTILMTGAPELLLALEEILNTGMNAETIAQAKAAISKATNA